MERIKIHYHGTEIEQPLRAKIKANISYHVGSAPSDASVCCCISNEDEGFAVNLQVHSAKGHVFIHRESKNLNQLLNFLYSSMDDSFKRWHQNPEHFAKTHPMEKNPCKSASHKNLSCPLDSFSHADWQVRQWSNGLLFIQQRSIRKKTNYWQELCQAHVQQIKTGEQWKYP